ncbi:hypothetical protein J1605_007610 [Eschrichtius robustus]|uniref:Uncharacterized protein n=1 Tax=Eschrichtius robustus TaxID=9764 RepID=A0AB34H038_ESCRO|nr:hypothetical protein J1605_007610 [Eschrichtius robustus]
MSLHFRCHQVQLSDKQLVGVDGGDKNTSGKAPGFHQQLGGGGKTSKRQLQKFSRGQTSPSQHRPPPPPTAPFLSFLALKALTPDPSPTPRLPPKVPKKERYKVWSR